MKNQEPALILIKETATVVSGLNLTKSLIKPATIVASNQIKKESGFIQKITPPLINKVFKSKHGIKNSKILKPVAKNKPLSNEITDCSNSGLKDLVENHKAAFVPQEFLGKNEEQEIKDYFVDYFIKFRIVLESKDVQALENFFVDSILNENFYMVSGYPTHVMSSIFSIIISRNIQEYSNIAGFSSGNLIKLLKTKNSTNVDHDSIDLDTINPKSFQKALEILVAKARSSDINNSEIEIIMTDDRPDSEQTASKIKSCDVLGKKPQKNFDIFQKMELKGVVNPKDIKVSGIEKTLATSEDKKEASVVFMGPLTKEESTNLKNNLCDNLIRNIDDQLAKKSITDRDRLSLGLAKQYVLGYKYAVLEKTEIFYQQKLDLIGWPIKNIVSSNSFE